MGKPINWPGMTNAALAVRLNAMLSGTAFAHMTAQEREAFCEAITRIEESPDEG